MASILSFRKNANGRQTAAATDSDDEDDGWVHGGRYVPASRTTQQPQQQRSSLHIHASSTPSLAATEGNIVATNVATQPQTQPSPYSMLSPPPLNTPLPSELSATHSSDAASFNNGMTSTATNNNSSTRTRTPMTVQLQRLLQVQPTPSTNANTPHHATTTTSAAHNINHPTSSGMITTPTQSNTNHHLPAAAATTPMGKFLLESGVPPTASLTIGQATSYIVSILFNLVIILYNTLLPWILTSHECFIRYIWNNLPQHVVMRDFAESIFEITIEGIQFVVFHLILGIIVPHVLWMIQTCIALVLTVGGTFLYGIVLVVKGSKSLADKSSVGAAQSSAFKSLKASVQNSPFVKKVRAEDDAWTGANWSVRRGGRLPFMGFSGVRTVERNNAVGGGRGNSEGGVEQQQQQVQVQQGSDGQGISVGNGASTSNAQQQQPRQSITSNNPVSNKSTTPIIRSSTLRQQTPYAGNANARGGGTTSTAATPATARRVLFSETAHGQVTTERFSYDKNLPASARKVDHRKLNNSNQQTAGEDQFSSVQKKQQQQVTPPKAGVSLGTEPKAATKPAPPKVAASSAASSVSKSTPTTSNMINKGAQSAAQLSATKKAFAHVAKTGSMNNNNNNNATTTAKKNTNGQQQQPAVQDEEQRKQQYIKRYGLLPSITPLSKRYGRMKQQGKSLGMASSSTTAAGGGGASNNAAAAKSNNRQIIKRKRRGDLLGAASRIGRTRRARLTGRSGHSSLPSLSRATPMKRPREDGGMSRADELVWKAMNSDGEKENRRNEGIGGVAKRGKFSSSTTSSAAATSGNVNPTPAPIGVGFSISTPPKTPGPSNFSLGSATPALKKSSDAGATPAKPSIPFSFGADDSNDAAPAKKDDSASGGGFTFGAKPASGAEEKDAAPGFSFGSTAASEKKDATPASAATAPGFSFNATTTASNAVPPAAEKKDAAPAFAFGDKTTKPAEASAPAPAAGFMFGGTATAKPEATPAPTLAPPAASFSFGGAAPAMPEASKTKESASGAGFTFGGTAATAPAPGFAFGNNTAPSAPTATQPKEPAGGFAFSSASAPSQPSASNPPTAGFSFGSTGPAAPIATALAAPAFGFGAAAPAQPAPVQAFGSTGPAAPTATAPAAPAFGFGAAAPPQPAPVQPAAFSFGGGAAAPGVPAASFGAAAPVAAANSFSLGGDGINRSRGGSVRRREKKAGGRRK